MNVPTADELVEMHARILSRTGGHTGLLNAESIASALDRSAWGPFYGADDLPHRAALLLRGLCQDHPFVDGNKRTAFEAADVLLVRNGLRLEAEGEEVVELMLKVAQAQLDVEGIADWIRARVRKPHQQERTE